MWPQMGETAERETKVKGRLEGTNHKWNKYAVILRYDYTFENECDKLYLHKYISIAWHLTTKSDSIVVFHSSALYIFVLFRCIQVQFIHSQYRIRKVRVITTFTASTALEFWEKKSNCCSKAAIKRCDKTY